MTDHHHHDGPTVVETERDSSAGLIVGVLVALLIVFLIWLFMFGPMNVRDGADDNNGDVTNIREGDEGDTDTDVNIDEGDTTDDTGGTGDTGGTSP